MPAPLPDTAALLALDPHAGRVFAVCTLLGCSFDILDSRSVTVGPLLRQLELFHGCQDGMGEQAALQRAAEYNAVLPPEWGKQYWVVEFQMALVPVRLVEEAECKF
jgi:hypothetical protein